MTGSDFGNRLEIFTGTLPTPSSMIIIHKLMAKFKIAAFEG